MVAPISDERFHAEHVQVLTDSLIAKTDELELVNSRLAALVELSLDLAAERDVDRMLEKLVLFARRVIPSRFVAVALFDASGERISWFHVSGAEARPILEGVEPRRGILGAIIDRRRPSRSAKFGGNPAALGFGRQHPPIESFLGVPLLTASQAVGWMYLADRSDSDTFTEDDERIASTLAAMFSIHFNNLRLSADLRTHAVRLEREVAERRRAEEEARRLARQNQQILDAAGEGIYGLDHEGRTTFINPAALRMFGYREDEILGRMQHDLVHHTRSDGTRYPRDECPIDAAFRDGVSHFADDEIFWRKDGSSFRVEFASTPIHGDDGTIVGAVVTFRDITERLKRQEELDQERRISALGRVSATIAHEFNNVLMGISPFCELLRRKPDDPAMALKAGETIQKSVLRGKNIVREILRFTRPEEPALQPLVVDAWLEEIMAEVRTLVGRKIEVRFEPLSGGAEIAADPLQLAQVLTNLAANARDAMDGKGEIAIGSEANDTSVFVHVSDRGSGIPPDIIDKIFDPLFTSKRGGTGLGLAVTHQIIRAHGGSITVSSRVGEGTAFTIELPRLSSERREVGSRARARGTE